MRILLSLLCVSMVLVSCSSFTIGEADVFYPKASVTPQTFDIDGVQLADTSVAVTDSVAVNAWHLTQPSSRATVLFFGGNGFYLVQSRGYLRALTRPSTDALLWDYRGYGRSDGVPSVEAFRHDALAMYDYLVEARGVNPDRLIVWGHSLGSFLATHVAERRSVAGVVLENPATDVDDWVGHLIPWYVRLFLNVEVDAALRAESNRDRVAGLQAPLLIVGGGEDTVTDPEMARELHAAAGSAENELVVVEDGGHNGLYDAPAVQSAYRALVEHVVADSAAAAEGP
jgi:pimeloyl-ACP methyl ester carboxylesterase